SALTVYGFSPVSAPPGSGSAYGENSHALSSSAAASNNAPARAELKSRLNVMGSPPASRPPMNSSYRDSIASDRAPPDETALAKNSNFPAPPAPGMPPVRAACSVNRLGA